MASLDAVASRQGKLEESLSRTKPPYLVRGDIIGICCPSGWITIEDIQPALLKLEEWGFVVKIGKTVGAKDFSYGGSDEERILDMQSMMDDTTVKAILFARGGYGAVRIIDKINFKRFIRSPKWLIGFSDATIFHTHISNYKIASIHSKMCNSFPKNWSEAENSQVESIDSIRKCLMGESIRYSVLPNNYNRQGSGSGILGGGNLSLLQNVSGTRSDIQTNKKILFIEDVGEYLYNIDRMLWNLKRSGKLDKLSGLIVGGFTNLKADEPGEEFGKTVIEIVMEKVKEFTYPVCFDFPVGHQKYNVALKCGVKHNLMVNETQVLLEEC